MKHKPRSYSASTLIGMLVVFSLVAILVAGFSNATCFCAMTVWRGCCNLDQSFKQ